MITFAKQYATTFLSSGNGEEGLLQECLNRLPLLTKVCAEFGANDGHTNSNTAWLILYMGWRGMMIESDEKLFNQCMDYWAVQDAAMVECIHIEVTPRNINDDLIPYGCSVLSIDTDGREYQLWESLEKIDDEIQPDIVIIEIDSSLDPTDPGAVNDAGGVGYLPMVKLGIAKGYFLLSHVGNLIFVDNMYRVAFPEITADPITEWEQYFNRSWMSEPTKLAD